ncbi:CaiB/BaiF CoA transferase family protein [Mycobacterium sp. 48b]|uniref:CaiB/BaiF CoA transferase family protein n=1 Tax=Mycobacterium sp. 48b TaxID=3400426 RepID=UPI003AABCEB6
MGEPFSARSEAAPLRGLRVLDLCRVVSGPFGSLLLADLGAEVIRVESVPNAANPPTPPTGEIATDEAFSWGLNRNKRSIAIDLKSEAGRDIFHRLVAEADVVCDNFRPGVTHRLKIDRDSLAVHNPSIITCSLTGFGADGPWASMPAYDPIVQAMCGTMNYTRLSPSGSPVRWGIPIGDLFAGIFTAIGIVAATIHRDRTGTGQHVDVAMLDVMLALNTYRVPQALTFDEEPVPAPFEGGQGTVPFGNFQCSTGWIATCISQRMWKSACEVFKRPELAEDERFSTGAARYANREELIALLQTIFLERTADDWQRDLMNAGVVCGKVTDVAEVFQHPQVLARGMAVEIQDAGGRSATVAGDPLGFAQPDTWCAPSPIGADTDLVLQELLGMAHEDISALHKSGVVFAGVGIDDVAPLRPHSRFVTPDEPNKVDQAPLTGVSVLELNGDEPSKCFAAQLLADLGADVIRVDRPVGQVIEPYPNEQREASFRAGLNRGKRSVIADLKTDDGKALFRALVNRADVVLDNYRPGVLKRLGIDNASLREINPRIISTSITGFGHTGPWSSFPAFDNAIQALGGGMSITVDPQTPDTPVRWGNPIGGLTGAMFAALGTLASIRLQLLTDEGSALDVSLLDSQVALLSYRVPQAVTVGRRFLPEPYRGGSGSLPFGAFPTAGGGWFVICITPQFWHDFCVASGHPEWENDPRFRTEPLRRDNEVDLYDNVRPVFLERTAQEWQDIYFRMRLPGASVLTIGDAFRHPQAIARTMAVTLTDAGVPGGIEVANSALKFSSSRIASSLNAPSPGENTAEIVKSLSHDGVRYS